MYEQIREDIFFVMLYTIVMTMAMMASCYLLFRRANAIAPDITTPVRLRRWTAMFFAFLALNHVWYMPIFFLDSSDEVRMVDLVGGLLDSMTFLPSIIIVLFAMLQDRRRPLWPVALMMAPIAAIMALYIVSHCHVLLPIFWGYTLLMSIGLIIYFVRAVRQYGRWLRDNYADLEHKEVWQSFLVLAIMFLVFGIYASTGEGPVYQYAMQAILVVFICYLLWRVETMSDLSQHQTLTVPAGDMENMEVDGLSPATHENIGQLLQQNCIDTQLYLQHDLTLVLLAKAVGTNRTYLGTYFAQEGITYNAYINDLRIQHFVRLYREAVAEQRPFTAQQLASESGYRSYSTFGLAFKQRMGQTVTAWMRDSAIN